MHASAPQTPGSHRRRLHRAHRGPRGLRAPLQSGPDSGRGGGGHAVAHADAPRDPTQPSAEPDSNSDTNADPVSDPAILNQKAVVVQIENHPEARPASNLGRADIVFEAPVEGDTTRYSAVYLCNRTEGLTGPVRSARYYNVDLWQDLHLVTMGFGASPGALERFARAGMPYLNGIDGAWPWFVRISQRFAPHNMYMDLEAARADIAGTGVAASIAAAVPPVRPPLSFDAGARIEGRSVGSVTIQTNSYWFFGWNWDPERGAWRRSDAGVPHIDAATGEPVSARTVVVQRVPQSVVLGDPDPGGYSRREQHLVGSGQGTVYVDGVAVDVAWSRPSVDAGTTWTVAATGEPLVLPPGQVWWEIVPLEAGVSEG